MSKVTLSNVGSLIDATTAASTINANFDAIETAFDNTLSLNGASPNQMLSNLDMNSNQILNLAAPTTVNSPARLIDVVTNPTITVPSIGTSGAVVGLLNTNNTYSGTSTFTGTVTTGAINTGAVSITGALLSTGSALLNGNLTIYATTSPPAGGQTAVGLFISSYGLLSAPLGIYFGSGAPSCSAAKGSLYLRIDGTTTNDRMYVNTNGGTSWAAILTSV